MGSVRELTSKDKVGEDSAKDCDADGDREEDLV